MSHLGQRDLVEIVWLYLLNLVRLPKLVNPFQLIEITISFFEDTIGKSSCNDFGAKIEEFALNRANIEDMVRHFLFFDNYVCWLKSANM